MTAYGFVCCVGHLLGSQNAWYKDLIVTGLTHCNFWLINSSRFSAVSRFWYIAYIYIKTLFNLFNITDFLMSADPVRAVAVVEFFLKKDWTSFFNFFTFILPISIKIFGIL